MSAIVARPPDVDAPAYGGMIQFVRGTSCAGAIRAVEEKPTTRRRETREKGTIGEDLLSRWYLPPPLSAIIAHRARVAHPFADRGGTRLRVVSAAHPAAHDADRSAREARLDGSELVTRWRSRPPFLAGATASARQAAAGPLRPALFAAREREVVQARDDRCGHGLLRELGGLPVRHGGLEWSNDCPLGSAIGDRHLRVRCPARAIGRRWRNVAAHGPRP